MKRVCVTLFALLLIIITVAVLAAEKTAYGGTETEYLRIHVRANSNERADQSVKYLVRDEVVKFITPYAAECVDKQTAIEVITEILPQLEAVCDEVLAANGFSYAAKASVRAEEFPTRNYGDLTLEQGVYDALIIELGSGTGDNWWCVIYPPLCFTSSTADVKYRSAILDIINKFLNR